MRRTTHFIATATLSIGVIAGLGETGIGALAQPRDLDFFDAPSPETPSGSQQAAASAEFQAGDAAYRDQRYEEAAEHFDEAHRLAPHHAALWNSARAWQQAGRDDRAATRFEQFLQAAPANATGVDEANRSLNALRSKVAAVEVRSNGAARVLVGATPYAAPRVYVLPGTYEVRGTFGAVETRATIHVEAGQSRTVSLAAPEPSGAGPAANGPAARPPPASPEPPPKIVHQNTTRGGLSPWFVVGGSSLTVALGVTAVWSVVEASDRQAMFDAEPTGENRKLADRAQVRTGSLVVGAGVAGVVTLGMTLFFVDWGSEDDTTTTWLSPSGFGLRKRF